MRSGSWMAALALAGAMGCAHESATWQGAKSDFAVAYDDVRSGVRQTAVTGKYALTDLGRGAVKVTDRSKETARNVGSKVEDGWITTKVKADLARTKGVKSGDIHADTNNGIVQLSGTVDSPVAAERAIDRTLGVRGVVAVDSKLQYPTETRPRRIYTPEDRPLPPR